MKLFLKHQHLLRTPFYTGLWTWCMKWHGKYMLKCLSSTILLSDHMEIWRYQLLGKHQRSTLNEVQHKYRFNSPLSAAPSTPSWFRNKVSLIKSSTHILPASKKDAHVCDETHVMRQNHFKQAMKLEGKPHQMKRLHISVLKKATESCCHCEGRRTSALFMTSSRCQFSVCEATITFHSLNVSRFSVAAHWMSELVKSDKRGHSKL